MAYFLRNPDAELEYRPVHGQPAKLISAALYRHLAEAIWKLSSVRRSLTTTPAEHCYAACFDAEFLLAGVAEDARIGSWPTTSPPLPVRMKTTSHRTPTDWPERHRVLSNVYCGIQQIAQELEASQGDCRARTEPILAALAYALDEMQHAAQTSQPHPSRRPRATGQASTRTLRSGRATRPYSP